MTSRKGGAISKEKRDRMEKVPSSRYDEDLILNSRCSKNFLSIFSQKKIIDGRIIDLKYFSDF